MNYLKPLLAAVAIVCAMPPAFAQLGNGGGTYSDVATSTDTAGDLLRAFVTVTYASMTAQATMLTLLGQPAEADKTIARMQSVNVDANLETIETALATQTQSGAALERLLGDKKVPLDEAAKRQFGEAVTALAQGVQQYATLSPQLPGIKLNLKRAGNKARSAFYASKTIAGSLGEMRQTLKAAVLFARANDIVLGADVAKTLAAG